MNQMSKYAMPSTTPLYHDAIKTIATSDDEMMPEHPSLSGVSIGGRDATQLWFVFSQDDLITLWRSVEKNWLFVKVFFLFAAVADKL
jgi:hypothetical protein